MKKYIIQLIGLTFICGMFIGQTTPFTPSKYDLTLVGKVKWRASLARYPISITRLLKKDLALNLIPVPGHYDFENVPLDEQRILQNPDKTAGNVAMLFDVLWDPHSNPSRLVPEKSLIKIAYSMLEGDAIPKQWVEILNKKFDLVCVPDDYYLSVYAKCGVKIPIFVVPQGVDNLEELLMERPKTAPSKPFVFGVSATFFPRKNHTLLIEAFQKQFGNNASVRLKIHGREGDIKELLKVKSTSENIEILTTSLSDNEYKEFLKSLDCYVLLSKGEGFSITPREALALGLPCIISDNTAHHTIAQTGFVYAVPSQKKEPALYHIFKGPIGFNFNCSVDDVCTAFRTVYDNYDIYLKKAEQGRDWVKQYLWKSAKAKFLTIIKPQNVLLGEENKVTDEFIMTNSPVLFRKYMQLVSAHLNNKK